MSYTALYRRYRSRTFGELVGQPHISRVLGAAVKRGNFVHAYLFCGPRGTGKTSAARIMARAINCQQPTDTGDPCGSCPACQRDLAGESMDVIEIDGASNRGIDEIRDLRERVKYAPAQEKYKIYIIDEVHMLTNDAFNALLKTLEEPPAHVVFIMATTAPHKVPLTVMSRCQRFDFRRIGDADITQHLLYIAQQEQIPLTEEAARLIARKSEGGMRDAISLLDQCASISASESGAQVDSAVVTALLGSMDRSFILDWLHLLLDGQTAAALQKVDELISAGRDLRQASDDLLACTRDLLLARLNHDAAISTAQSSDIPDWAGDFAPAAYLGLLQSLSDVDAKLRYSLSPRIALELALIRATGLPGAAPEDRAEGAQPRSETPAAAEQANTATARPTVTAANTARATAQPEARTARPAAPAQAANPQPSSPPAPASPSATNSEQSSRGVAAPSISLEQIQGKWEEILQRVELKNAGAAVILRDAIPHHVQGNKLFLDFPPDDAMMMDTIISPVGYKTMVENAINLSLRANISIEGFLGEARDVDTDSIPAEDVPPPEEAPPEPEQSSLF